MASSCKYREPRTKYPVSGDYLLLSLLKSLPVG
ncbi:uncharacterized protein METZ01_LOCUS253821, partial [marine metagenome]